MAKRKYRVEFDYMEVDGSKRAGKMTIPLSPAARHTADGLEGPWIIEGAPFMGELDEYEVAMLTARPGVYFNPGWRFKVTGDKKDG